MPTIADCKVTVRALLCKDAAAFKKLCHTAVEALDLPAWSERGYRLLATARRVAAVESLNDTFM